MCLVRDVRTTSLHYLNILSPSHLHMVESKLFKDISSHRNNFRSRLSRWFHSFVSRHWNSFQTCNILQWCHSAVQTVGHVHVNVPHHSFIQRHIQKGWATEQLLIFVHEITKDYIVEFRKQNESKYERQRFIHELHADRLRLKWNKPTGVTTESLQREILDFLSRSQIKTLKWTHNWNWYFSIVLYTRMCCISQC